MPLQFNGWNQDGLTISNTAWEDLSPEQQQVMYEGTRAWLESYTQDQIEYYWQFATQAQEHGVQFDTPDPAIQEQIDAYHQTVLTTMATTAPPSVQDPQAFLTEYQAANEKWLGIVEELGFSTDYTGLDGFVASLDNPDQAPEIDLDPWLDRVMLKAYGIEPASN